MNVAVITAIGFAIGVAWPRLAGIRPGPSVPEVASAAASAAPPAAEPAHPVAASPGSALAPARAIASAPAVARAPATVPAAAPPPAAAAAETAQVGWKVAIVRDAPKTGKILARLQRGMTLRIGSVKDGWYPVKYGDDFASEGWVYRAAIGR